MAGRLVLQGVLVLCLVQAAHTGGNVPQNGGRAASFLIPSKGYGAGMNKGVGINGGRTAAANGYGAKAGPANLQKMNGGFGAPAGGYGRQAAKGNGAAAASQSGFGNIGNGYGVISGPTTLQQIKGYGAPAGPYLGPATKGNGYGAHAAAYGGQGDKGNGYGAQAGGYGGQGSKGNGQRLAGGASSSNEGKPNGQGHGGNRLKGYGRPHYIPAVGMGQFRGPRPVRDQGNVYGGNGYRTHPTKGFNGGYGGAGLGLGSLYGNGIKGPMKGYSASAGVSNGQGSQSSENGRIQGAKEAKPDCGASRQWMKRLKSGGFNFPGLSNGHGAGLAYPYGGSIAQPGYGQGVYPAAGYENLYGALGQSLPAAEQSGGTTRVSFGEAPAGIDGISQLEAQPAGRLPNGAPPGGQTLGLTAEKSNSKYGVGGLQFGEPVHLGTNGAGNYGYGGNLQLPAGDGKAAGKYGYGGVLNGGQLLGLGNNGNVPDYGTLPYEAQPAGFTPEAISAGQHGLIGSPYHPAPSGFGYNGKSAAKYENVGYLKGQVKPEAVALPTPSLSLEDSPDLVGSFTPDEGVKDLSDGTAGLLDSSPAAETRGEAHLSENPDDLQLPRQIQIQQQLKLHFHPQGGKKYDLNGFFGNSDHQD
ncbi:calymmin isoform X9 [Gambusia affinis]|uniref:calymmin isoform X9 n=1 Tax=Gambusia affinis TaxID=33528 RepID=UPI001CDB8F88|nr:calymmin isoform X9 [Gambusia affinis]